MKRIGRAAARCRRRRLSQKAVPGVRPSRRCATPIAEVAPGEPGRTWGRAGVRHRVRPIRPFNRAIPPVPRSTLPSRAVGSRDLRRRSSSDAAGATRRRTHTGAITTSVSIRNHRRGPCRWHRLARRRPRARSTWTPVPIHAACGSSTHSIMCDGCNSTCRQRSIQATPPRRLGATPGRVGRGATSVRLPPRRGRRQPHASGGSRRPR